MDRKTIKTGAGILTVAALLALLVKNKRQTVKMPKNDERAAIPSDIHTDPDVTMERSANSISEISCEELEQVEDTPNMEQIGKATDQKMPGETVKTVQTGRRVGQYDDDMKLIAEYDSATAAAKAVGSNRTSIRDAANGKQKHAAGFVWRYLD